MRPASTSPTRCFIRTLRSILRQQQAQALIELALVAPVLLILLIGSAELARIAYGAIEVSNAAAAAVAYGAQNNMTISDTTGMQHAAASDASNIALDTSTVSISCVCSDGSASTCALTDCSTSHMEKTLTVQTQATITTLLNVSGLPKTFTVHGQAVQKCLQC